MRKSTLLQYKLMKRRYSVPETIMRKHELQEVALRKQNSDSVITKGSSSSDLENGLAGETELRQMNETPVHAGSCLDEDEKYITSSSKKHNLKSRRRKGIRSLKRSTSSYCQYRYSMSAFSRKILARRISKSLRTSSSFDNRNETSADSGNHVESAAQESTRLPEQPGTDAEPSATVKSTGRRFPDIKKSCEFLQTTSIDTSITSNDKVNGRTNQNSNESDTPANSSLDLCQNLQDVDPDFPLIMRSESVFFHPGRARDSACEKHCISIKISPFSNAKDYLKTEVKIGIDRSNTKAEDAKADEFGKVCYENLKTTEITNEHRKIQREFKSGSPKRRQNQPAPERENEEIKLRQCRLSGITAGARTLGETDSDRHLVQFTGNGRKKELITDSQSSPTRCSTSQSQSTDLGSTDCSVPMFPSSCFSPRTKEDQQLNIQVCVGNVNSLEESAVGGCATGDVTLSPYSEDYRSSGSKYERNTKMALSYLFQKLGDSYPKPQKRLLLKKPTFANYNNTRSHTHFDQYYSHLPKLLDVNRSGVPVSLMYDCLQQRESFDVDPRPLKKREDNQCSGNELSDSDISIADSLEDSQHSKGAVETTKEGNVNGAFPTDRYRRYDNKVARGDIDAFMRSAEMENKERSSKESDPVHGISYFLHLLDVTSCKNDEDNVSVRQEVVDKPYVPPNIPTNLLEKLNKRSNSISKHAACSATMTGKKREFVHKQIQTCFNARESLRRKRRTPRMMAEPTIDKRIAKILMTGLKIQEDPGSSSPELSQVDSSTKVTIQTSNEVRESVIESRERDRPDESSPNSYDMILREEEIERINSSSFDYYRAFEKSRRYRLPAGSTKGVKGTGCDSEPRNNGEPNNGPKYRYQEKLKYFKERKIRKQRDGEIRASSCGGTSNPAVDSQPKSFSSTASSTIRRPVVGGEKSDSRIKNGRPKTKLSANKGNQRFRQKFEAIPEEMAGNSIERQDANGNYDNCNASGKLAPVHKTLDERQITPAIDIDFVKNSGIQSSCNSENETVERTCQNNNGNESLTDTKAEVHEIEAKCDPKVEFEEMTDSNACEMQFQNRGDLLYSSGVQEELITLSKGWINFYLLKATNIVPDGVLQATEKSAKVENVPELFLPQQYMLHIQAAPQHLPSNSFSSKQPVGVLPELHLLETLPPRKSAESKWRNVSSKIKSSLPDIEKTKSSPFSSGTSTTTSIPSLCPTHRHETIVPPSTATESCRSSSPLPKLRTSNSDEDANIHVRPQSPQAESKIRNDDVERDTISEITEPEPKTDTQNYTNEAISTPWLEAVPISESSGMNVQSTTSASASLTSSNYSASSAGNEIELMSILQTDPTVVEDTEDVNKDVRATIKNKKLQHYQRPQMYQHSTRQDGYRRSLSVESNRKPANRKNNSSSSMVDIEMRLLVKNHGLEDNNGNRTHSWKFTLTSDDSNNSSKNERTSKSRYAQYTANQNTHFQNQNRIVKLSGCSENSSTSTSIHSFDRKKQNKETKFTAKCELNGYPLRSDDKLTITGSTITPESKPKPPTMSERDLTRKRLSRHSSNMR